MPSSSFRLGQGNPPRHSRSSGDRAISSESRLSWSPVRSWIARRVAMLPRNEELHVMWAPEAARRATSPLGPHGCRYGGDAVRMRLTSGSPQRAEAPLGGSEGASGASVEPVRWRGRRLRLSKYYGDRGPTDCMPSLRSPLNERLLADETPDDVN